MPATIADLRRQAEAEQRSRDRGEPHGDDTDRALTYALLTPGTDGALGIVTSPVHQLHALIDPTPLGERGRDNLPLIPGLGLYFSATDDDPRPLNLVANRLASVLDPEGGHGRYRGTVALVGTECDSGLGALVDITAEQREQVLRHYRDALASVRDWQRRKNAD